MRLVFKIFFLTFIFTSFLLKPQFSIAQEDINLKKEAINPGSFYYSFKRFWEKGVNKLQLSQQSKIDFRTKLLKTRLSELNYIVENKILAELQTSTERFAYQAGILKDELIKQDKSENKGKAVKEFEQYSRFLEGLRDNFPANSSFWMLVQHDINTLGLLSDQLK